MRTADNRLSSMNTNVTGKYLALVNTFLCQFLCDVVSTRQLIRTKYSDNIKILLQLFVLVLTDRFSSKSVPKGFLLYTISVFLLNLYNILGILVSVWAKPGSKDLFTNVLNNVTVQNQYTFLQLIHILFCKSYTFCVLSL